MKITAYCGLVAVPYIKGTEGSGLVTKTLRIMRLTIILLTALCVQVSANVWSQTIRFDGTGVPLEKVFQQIEKQTNYFVVYDPSVLEAAHPVTVRSNNLPLDEFLEKVLKGQLLTYSIKKTTIFITKKERLDFLKTERKSIGTPDLFVPITGRVTDGSGRVLAGATVRVKGLNISAITNDDGIFQLNADIGSVLDITYVGFKSREVTIKDDKQISIVLLQNSGNMDTAEIIVNTGYQALPKERATGSFTSISNDEINLQAGPNILDRLKGIANAVLFDNNISRPAITVRGVSTIDGPKTPLIVLDNFPYEGNINNINPNDIENITILKDAAAASIWGTKAGNGVIVITTKKGKFNQKTTLQINANTSMVDKPDLFSLQRMSTSDFIDVETMLYQKGYYAGQINSVNKPALSPVVELLLQNAPDYKEKIDLLRNKDIRNDYYKYVYNNAINQQYAVNLRGGSDKISYLFSGGFDNNIGHLSETSSRINARSENSFRPYKGLVISSSVLFTHTISKNGREGFDPSISGVPYLELANEEGKPVGRNLYRQGFLDTAGQAKLLDWYYYPMEEYKNVHLKDKTQDLIAAINIQYRFMKHFNLDIKFQHERQENTSENLRDGNSYFARDLINRFTQINYTSGAITRAIPLGGVMDISSSTLQSLNYRGQLNYDLVKGKHTVSAIAGSEVRQNQRKGSTFRTYGYNPDILTISNVDFVNTYPTFINNNRELIPNNTGFRSTTDRFVSFYANAAYTYNSKYILSGSVRNDASNLFGVATNKKWQPLWSAGVAWNISEEAFFRNDFLSVLKFRGTFGYSGNVDQSQSALTIIRYLSNGQYTNYRAASINKDGNPQLKWETVKTLNIGFDFELKRKILSGSIDYYIKTGEDLFGAVPIDYTAGLYKYFVVRNVAGMRGNGIDISLRSKNIDRKNIKWTTSAQLNYNASKVTDYYHFTMSGSNYVSSSGTFIVGKPRFSLFSYKWGGLNPENGDPLGYVGGDLSKDWASITGEGTKISDLVYSGSATPTLFGAVNNAFSYKGVGLSVNITYKLYYYFRKTSIQYSQLLRGHPDFAKRWQVPGDELKTEVPSMIYPANSSRDAFYGSAEHLIRKADHARVQFINISYDLSGLKTRASFLNAFKLYAIINNPGIVWKANKEGIDPEYENALAPSKTITFGINANF